MKIIVMGIGRIGSHVVRALSEMGHDVIVIEKDMQRVEKTNDELNVKAIQANGVSAEVLVKEGIAETDIYLGLTGEDITNLFGCSVAKKLGAKMVIARTHDMAYSNNVHFNYQLHFDIDLLVTPEILVAIELAKVIRNPERVMVESFARGKIEVQSIAVPPQSTLVNRTLKDISLSSKVRIGMIQKGNKTIIPQASTVIESGDQLTLVGFLDTLSEVKQYINSDSLPECTRVMLFGGTETALNLIRLLNNPRFRIKILEKNKDTCIEIAEKFPHVTVIEGDATSKELLEEEDIGICNFFISCTKQDELNIMVGIQAHSLGAKEVLVIINKPDYEQVLDHLKGILGFKWIGSPREALLKEVLRTISLEGRRKLMDLPNHSGVIQELKVSCDSPVAGQFIRDIEWPKECVLVALQHKFDAKVPSADDRIVAGDRLVAIVSHASLPVLEKMLT